MLLSFVFKRKTKDLRHVFTAETIRPNRHRNPRRNFRAGPGVFLIALTGWIDRARLPGHIL